MKLNPFKEEAKVALLVDGPNLLRKEFSIDLRELKRRAKKYGRIVVAKVFINQFAPEKLIEAIINEGFECVMVLAEKEESDVDVSLAVAAVETILTKDVDVIALATRDADFLPVIQKAKEYGKKAIVIAPEPGLSSGLKNAADKVEKL
ncbi:MAG: NYN domain-containing protein [Candidatus Aenigmatarchaeota archaeon]|nr:MAG: NYN domain-containing protein [Candidatus Aenigmarchaeota archaeon]